MWSTMLSLLIGAEAGLLGLAAFTWFLISIMAQAWRLTNTASNDIVWVVGVGVLSGYIALSAHSLGDYTLIGCSRMFVQFWFLAGITTGLASRLGHDPVGKENVC